MRLEYALQNWKVWLLAVVAGLLGVLVHGKRTPTWSFVAYFIAAVAVAMVMPLTTRKSVWLPYFAYGLVAGALAGATHPSADPRSRLLAALKGAGLGVGVNLVLRLTTYS